MKYVILSFCLLFSLSILNAQKGLPSAQVKTLDGKSMNIQEVGKKGKITVISFWATWCSPCKKELDAIHKVYADWQSKYNMELVAVTIDDARALPKVGPMVKQKQWNFTVLSDVNKQLKEALQIQTVPFTLLLDKKGNIVYKHSGYVPGDEKELEKKIAELN